MKRRVWFLEIMLAMCVSMLIGCGITKESERDTSYVEEVPIKVVHYVSGKLGDKSFFDSAERGLKKSEMVYGHEASTIEGGNDSAVWASDLEELAASEKYDNIIVGTFPMTDTVRKLAQQYPDQRFIFYDDSVKDDPNVYSMAYSQSEGSF
ncbi:BMP family ABC transporter substrate-binding protein [Paenibacillus alkaliterrae]|nr:BMP family ABC transporter substrate-binding protein [Paenibacillus alkaliterrae]MCF2940798.1 BMP family ABC transporter substrate-binding protein [Paenibacillus alkaliterrae]